MLYIYINKKSHFIIGSEDEVGFVENPESCFGSSPFLCPIHIKSRKIIENPFLPEIELNGRSVPSSPHPPCCCSARSLCFSRLWERTDGSNCSVRGLLCSTRGCRGKIKDGDPGDGLRGPRAER